MNLTSMMSSTPSSARARAAATLATATTLTFALAGCSGSSSSPSAATATTAGAAVSSASTASLPGSRSTSSGPQSSGSAATTASGGGTQGPTVPQRTQETRAPISLTAHGNFGGNVTGAIADVTSIKATAKLPGEVSGPGLAVAIALTNGSTRPIDVNNTVVNVAYGALKAPGSPMSGPPSSPFRGTLAPGKTASAVYVFAVAAQKSGALVRVEVSYSPLAPIVVFSGAQR